MKVPSGWVLQSPSAQTDVAILDYLLNLSGNFSIQKDILMRQGRMMNFLNKSICIEYQAFVDSCRTTGFVSESCNTVQITAVIPPDSKIPQVCRAGSCIAWIWSNPPDLGTGGDSNLKAQFTFLAMLRESITQAISWLWEKDWILLVTNGCPPVQFIRNSVSCWSGLVLYLGDLPRQSEPSWKTLNQKCLDIRKIALCSTHFSSLRVHRFGRHGAIYNCRRQHWDTVAAASRSWCSGSQPKLCKMAI